VAGAFLGEMVIGDACREGAARWLVTTTSCADACGAEAAS